MGRGINEGVTFVYFTLFQAFIKGYDFWPFLQTVWQTNNRILLYPLSSAQCVIACKKAQITVGIS